MSEGGPASYRCGLAARWLPRTLAASVLVAGLLAGARVESGAGVPGARSVRLLVLAVSAVGAIWILHKGGEVRLRVVPGREALAFELGGRTASLPLDDIDAIRYEGPFGASRSWLPAAVLVDREGRGWRLCALLGSGDRLVREIVERSGRSGLATWVEAHRVEQRMARSAARIRLGYAVSLALLAAPVLLYLR